MRVIDLMVQDLTHSNLISQWDLKPKIKLETLFILHESYWRKRRRARKFQRLRRVRLLSFGTRIQERTLLHIFQGIGTHFKEKGWLYSTERTIRTTQSLRHRTVDKWHSYRGRTVQSCYIYCKWNLAQFLRHCTIEVSYCFVQYFSAERWHKSQEK